MNTTPDPTNGSMKRPPPLGSRRRPTLTSCLFAPAHFKKGFTVVSITYAAMLLTFIKKSSFSDQTGSLGRTTAGGPQRIEPESACALGIERRLDTPTAGRPSHDPQVERRNS